MARSRLAYEMHRKLRRYQKALNFYLYPFFKVNEIAFINTLEAQNKKMEVMSRHQVLIPNLYYPHIPTHSPTLPPTLAHFHLLCPHIPNPPICILYNFFCMILIRTMKPGYKIFKRRGKENETNNKQKKQPLM